MAILHGLLVPSKQKTKYLSDVDPVDLSAKICEAPEIDGHGPLLFQKTNPFAAVPFAILQLFYLIPHDAITGNMTLEVLASRYRL